MRANDITVLVPGKTAAPTPQRMATRGTVTIPPASLTDDTVTVVLPSYSPDYGWPCRWIRQGTMLPATGAECLVLWDETGAGTVVQWAGAGTGAAALDARLDALEATRTVRGTVSSTGTITAGSGWTAVRNGTGDYSVTFGSAFSGVPSVPVGAGATAAFYVAKISALGLASTTGFRALCFNPSTLAGVDGEFHFVATGPA